MILYYSGTGNSAWAAKRLAAQLDEEAINLFDRLRRQDHTPLYSDRPWTIVSPTYAWQLPRLVWDWLRQTPLNGNPEISFLLTCGGGIGNAAVCLKRLCQEMHMTWRGCQAIVMPENYITLFKAPDEEAARQIIRRAGIAVDAAAAALRNGRLPDAAGSLPGRLQSGIVNRCFYRFMIKSKPFRTTSACTGCGHCASVCPTGGIRMEAERPLWIGPCTHCMACICTCPAAAVEYGSRTKNKRRYVCPLDT